MSPRGRGILLGLAALAFLAPAPTAHDENPVRGVSQVGWVEVRRADPRQRLRDLAATAVPSFFDAQSRVGPDRRALYAVAEVRRLLGGTPERAVVVRFEGGRWIVQLGEEDVGPLPELPSFEDLRSLVTGWAERERKATRAAPSTPRPPGREDLARSLETAPVADVLDGLRSLEGDWTRSPGDPEIARLACRALLWIHLQTADDLQLADPILGKSLALLALLPGDNAREAMLLAHQMGYESPALESARRLPAGDPDRLFVERRDAELAALAGSRPNSRIEYLHLLRFASRGDGDGLAEALARTSWAKELGAPTLSLLLRGREFGTDVAAAGALKTRLFSEVFSGSFPRPENRPPTRLERLLGRVLPSGEPEGQLKEFESRLTKSARRMGGRLLDPETIEAYYLSGLYTSVHVTAQFLIDRFSSSSEARGYANLLVDLPPGTATELHRWLTSRLALLEGAPDGLVRVQEDLATLRYVGLEPLARIRYSLRWANRLDWGSQIRTPMRGFFASLDTRPSNLWVAGPALVENLQDPKRAETYLRTAAASAPILGDRKTPWVSRLVGDVPALRDQAHDASLTLPVRAFALKSLSELPGCDLREIEAAYLELARERRGESDAIKGYVELARRRGAHEAALSALANWLDAHESDNGLERAHMQTLRASILRGLGRLQEAKEENDLALGTWWAGSVEEGAEILIALGRLDEAERLARAGLERYPEGGEFPALLAECAWRRGDALEAARVLRKARPRMSQRDWRTVVAPRFATGIAARDPVFAERAFEAFLPVPQDDFDLDDIVDEIEKAGNPALAARLLPHVGAKDLSRIVRIFQLREKSESRAAALAWLRPRIPALSPQFPLYAFYWGEDELLWDAYEGDPKAASAEFLQLMRAAALARGRRSYDPRLQAVRAFFSGKRVRPLAREMGVHLLNGGDESVVWRAAQNDEQRSIGSWALGLRAESDGRLAAANDWYQVGFELGRELDPTRWFAFRTVEKWKEEIRIFSRMAADARR